MSTYHNRIYQTPVIELIILDFEISLAFQSDDSEPPSPETNNSMNSIDYFNQDPFNVDLG